jgi:hypothetical protein
VDQHPTRQIPDDELVEIADRPQLWISQDSYATTLRAGLTRGAYHRPRTLALSIGKPYRCQGGARPDVTLVEPPGDCSGEAPGLSCSRYEGGVSFLIAVF